MCSFSQFWKFWKTAFYSKRWDWFEFLIKTQSAQLLIVGELRNAVCHCIPYCSDQITNFRNDIKISLYLGKLWQILKNTHFVIFHLHYCFFSCLWFKNFMVLKAVSPYTDMNFQRTLSLGGISEFNRLIRLFCFALGDWIGIV